MEIMPTRVGVGRSQVPDAFEAGAAAARAALDRAGAQRCDFVLLFATVGFDQERLLAGVRSETGSATLAGCSAEGIITQDGPAGETVFTNEGPCQGTDTVAVTVWATDELTFDLYSAQGMREQSLQTGAEIGRGVRNRRVERPLLLWMFVDGLTSNVKDFFTGLESVIRDPYLYVGALGGDNFILGRAFQYANDRVLSDGAVCVLVSGDLSVDVGVTHGCVPIGTEKRITKARANTVFEIDRMTAWSFFKQYLDDKWTKFTREIRTFLDFGIKLPDHLATEYDRYLIRAPMSQNADDSLNFATEIPEGTMVQVIRRDADKTSQGARAMAGRMRDALSGREIVAVLHIDCAARGRMFFGEEVKAKGIDVLQDTLGKDLPWCGVYACGEIAPIKGVNYYHNQTAVLCVLYR
jgi:hypothetical protein